MKEIEIPIAELFGPTIQGEGPEVGVKTLFLRVVGCDFSCEWCDSKFAWTPNSMTKYYSTEELVKIILDKCNITYTKHLVITGGNPCLYDLKDLILKLKSNHIKVDIETQGSFLPEWLSICDQIVISPKAPSSKMKDVYEGLDKWLDFNLHPLTIAIKIPIFDLVDFEFALRYYKLIKKYKDKHNIKFYLSVGNDNVEENGIIYDRILNNYKNLIDLTMKSELENVYILPQVHTLIWGNKQGV